MSRQGEISNQSAVARKSEGADGAVDSLEDFKTRNIPPLHPVQVISTEPEPHALAVRTETDAVATRSRDGSQRGKWRLQIRHGAVDFGDGRWKPAQPLSLGGRPDEPAEDPKMASQNTDLTTVRIGLRSPLCPTVRAAASRAARSSSALAASARSRRSRSALSASSFLAAISSADGSSGALGRSNA